MLQKPTDLCIQSLLRKNSSAGISPENILIVDNSRDGWAEKRYNLTTYRDPYGHNLGVARSWNVAAKEVLYRKLDYLLIMSVSMVFGPMLHTTWVEQMQNNWGENVIEATGHSWHLIAIHRRVFETIGLFDENFYPAYFEADDFSYRMRQVGMQGGWSQGWVNAMSQGVAMHIRDVSCPHKPLIDYYWRKWGGEKGAERWTKPFGDKPLDYWPERTIEEIAHAYSLGRWW